MPFQYSYLVQWPNDQYPLTPDPPFIAPFYSDADFDFIDSNDDAQLSYRILDLEDTSKPANEQVNQCLFSCSSNCSCRYMCMCMYMHMYYMKTKNINTLLMCACYDGNALTRHYITHMRLTGHRSWHVESPDTGNTSCGGGSQ